MTIDKAITLLQTEARFCRAIDARDWDDATRLAIHALKRVRWARTRGYHCFLHPLPGETDDDDVR